MRSKVEFLAFHLQWLFASTFPNVIYKLLLRIALDILLISKKRAKLCWVEKLLLTCQTVLKYFKLRLTRIPHTCQISWCDHSIVPTVLTSVLVTIIG